MSQFRIKVYVGNTPPPPKSSFNVDGTSPEPLFFGRAQMIQARKIAIDGTNHGGGEDGEDGV